MNKSKSAFKYFYSVVGARLFMMLLFSLFVGFLDGIGLTMFLPLIQMASEGASSGNSMDIGNLGSVVTMIESLGITLNVKSILIMISVFFALKGAIKFIEASYKVIVFQFFMKSLRVSNVQLLSNYRYSAFVTSDAGRIQNTLSGEMARVASAFGFYQSALQSATMIIVYMSLAFMTNAQFALLISVGGICSNLIFRTIYLKTTQISRTITSIGHEYHGLLIQMVANFKYLVATGQMKKYSNKLLKSVDDMVFNNKKIGIYNSILLAVREPIIIIVVMLVILIQISLMGKTIGPIILALLFFYRALNFVISLQTQWNSFLNNKGALENLQDFQEELSRFQVKDLGEEFKGLVSTIDIIDGSFSYGQTSILKNIDLTIYKNTTIALVGESGSGKTTLVNIISGLLKFDNGTVKLDGKNIDQIHSSTFQKKIGYITQEPVVFNDSIFNNITMWDQLSQTNLESFWYALRLASLDDFVHSLEKKEHTVLGNSGINLSGGQKQRISIARELYKNIEILIMDEATSALDSETELAIQENIDALKGKYTIFIVAHRLSTIKNADVVVLMDKGQIIANGSYQNLLKTSKKFQRMVTLQELVNS